MLPKLIITDIDGVWTDGGMYYDKTGNELKKFNTADSAGVLFARLLGIPVAIITGENTQIVQRRADKLKIDFLFMGIKDKVATATALKEKLQIEWTEIAFIGDDINDILLLQKVGISACPANAPSYVQRYAQKTLPIKGGDGAFRAFVEMILQENNVLEDALNAYFASLNLEQ